MGRTNTLMKMGMAVFAGVFTKMLQIRGTNDFHRQLQVRIPGRKRGRGRRAGRVVDMRHEDEAHLYGDKLARKAHRHAMTIKCARL